MFNSPWPRAVSQVVNAIHGAFKNGYFSSICTLQIPNHLSMKIIVTPDLNVSMHYQTIVLSYELHVFFVTMTPLAMVTMATMAMCNISPQKYIFGPGAIASKGLHEIFSLTYVHISLPNQAILGGFQCMVVLRKYWCLQLKIFTKMPEKTTNKLEYLNYQACLQKKKTQCSLGVTMLQYTNDS